MHHSWPTSDGVLLIGHLTRDRIRVGERSASAPGGTVHYAGVAYARLGQPVRVFTKAAALDADELAAPLRSAGCPVHVVPSACTTAFENVLSSDLRARSQRVESVAEPFEVGEVAFGSRAIVHLGPLTHAEMSAEFVEAAAARASVIVLDAQGFVRQLHGERVEPVPWADATRLLPLCGVVKADDTEAAHVTGERAADRAALALHGHGAREVLVTMAHEGSFVAVDGAVHHVAALPPPSPVDSTGAGDTFTAAYVVARMRGQPPLEAAHFASAAASLSLAHTGPFSGSMEDVKRHLRGH
jgi:sugar/nucleoside kinase (ribokinase family)